MSKFRSIWLCQFMFQILAVSFVESSVTCRCVPDDDCWPTADEWTHFDESLERKLVKTVPLASPCHEPNFDPTQCQYLQRYWPEPDIHDSSSSSIMAAAVANQSCDPFTAVDSPCTLGNMVVYAVNASTPSDISKTIQFSKDKNLRLVVRNTGHDYLGKSTGAGALSIWTHHLKQIDFLDYVDPYYDGPAVKLGAGVQGFEVYAAADKRGMVVVGGECATVGLVGGYTQGGGHSAISSKFGLGADQTLEWEVIDGNGQFRKASRTENSDLYWALSGGGGGTFGIVYSLTVKVRPDFPVAGVVLNFTSEGVSSDVFFDAVEYYHEILPTLTDAGGMAIAEVSNTSFLLTPLTLPNTSIDETNLLMQPLTKRLDQLQIRYDMNITMSSTYLQHYNKLIEPNPTQLVDNAQYGGHLVPLSVIQNNNTQLTAAVRKITMDGASWVSIGLNVSSVKIGNTNNSVFPSWRTAAMDVILTSSWPESPNLEDMHILAEKMTTEWVPSLAALAPEAGCYMNEADPNQPNWKEAFYGINYPNLYSIKQKFDPDKVFYAPTAVGSDDWQVAANGALCRVQS